VRYRRKPTEITAVHYEHESDQEKIVSENYGLWGGCGGRGELIGMTTIHGDRAYAKPGDWIASEPDPGRFYPIRSDIFTATYEAVQFDDPGSVD
jgi:hypothetical protein